MKRPKLWLKAVTVVVAALVLLFVAFVWWMLPGRYDVTRDVELPTRYAGDRFFVEPITTTGVKLNLLTDTGGGLMLSSSALERCGLQPRKILGSTLTRLPVFRSEAWIPEPTGGEKWMPVSGPGDADGMLGQRWFAGGVWTFDYPAQKLILRASSFSPTAEMKLHAAPLGFHKAALGYRDLNHPRIVVSVAGEPVAALFDTGATVWLSATATNLMNTTDPVERGTSFAQASLFERWHRAHPDWREIEQGCAKTHEAMIEVPEVEVAGLKAGPVWFTRRQDGNYAYMSRFTSEPIVAAVGGNILRHFRVTVDYPKASAYFEAAEH